MDKDEANITRLMTQFARKNHASDARMLDLRFDKPSGRWLAMSRSKKAGFQELVAELDGDGKWTVSHHEKAHPGARGANKVDPPLVQVRRDYSHATFDSPLKSLGKLIAGAFVLIVLAGVVLIVKPQIERVVAEAKKATPPPSANLSDGLSSGMMNAAGAMAKDPKAQAAADAFVKKNLSSQGAEAYSQQQQLNQTGH